MKSKTVGAVVESIENKECYLNLKYLSEPRIMDSQETFWISTLSTNGRTLILIGHRIFMWRLTCLVR